MADIEERSAINLSDEEENDGDLGFIEQHNRQLLESDEEEDDDERGIKAGIDQKNTPLYSSNGSILTPEHILAEQIKSQIVQQSLALLFKDPISGKYSLKPETPILLTEIRENLYTDDSYNWVVSVACGESSLMDCILEILQLWGKSLEEDEEIEVPFAENFDDGFSIAAECVEILSFLTKWYEIPSVTDQENGEISDTLIANYYALKKHQLVYKKKLLSKYGGSTFLNLIKVCSFIINKPQSQRMSTDWNTLRFCLETIAHIPAIEPAAAVSTAKNKNSSKTRELPSVLPLNLSLTEIDSNVCINVYHDNKVLDFIVMLCSILKQLKKDFVTECLHDVLYHLTKKVNAASIYRDGTLQSNKSFATPKGNISSTSGEELKELMSKEAQKNSQFINSTRSSRHGRFGTLLQVKTSNINTLTVSGASHLQSADKTNIINDFERHKKWRLPVRVSYGSDEDIVYSFDSLNSDTREILYGFTQNFLKSGASILIGESTRFLISNLEDEEERKNKARGIDKKPLALRRQRYFVLIAWILRFFQSSNEGNYAKAKFQNIVGAFTDSSFILVNRALDSGFFLKDWALAHSGLICVMEMIRVSKRFDESNDMGMKMFGESLKERLFHRTENIQNIVKFTRDAAKRSPRFISTCVELMDLLISTLEDISNENMTEIVKRKKTVKSKRIYTFEQQMIDDLDISDRSQFQEKVMVLSAKRKESFKKFQSKLVNSGTIKMYVTYLERFQDLSDTELKRAIKFLHRLFFQMKKYPALYRMDFLLLLHKMVAIDGLPKISSARKHVEQFLEHFMKKFKKSLLNSSSTLVELLFHDIRDKKMSHFLETGSIMENDKEKITTVKKIATIRGDKDNTMTLERKCAIMVASLIDDDKLELVNWTVKQMEKVYVIRCQQLQIDNPIDDPKINVNLKDIKVEADESKFQKTLIIEPKVRYLFQLAGFQLPLTIEDPCYFSKSKPVAILAELMGYVDKYTMTPVEFENGKVASDFVQVRLLSKYYNDLNKEDGVADDDEFGGSYSDDEDDEIAFEVTGERRKEVGYLDDELDQLEDAIDRSERGNGQKGVARSKKKDREGAHLGKRANTSKKTKTETAKRRRIDSKSKADINHSERLQEKSSRYIEDSDSDDADDDDFFFLREKMLHNFYIENNGVPSKEAVTEFMRDLDAKLNSSRKDRIDKGKGKKKEALFVSDDENEDSDVVDDSDDIGVMADDYEGPIGKSSGNSVLDITEGQELFEEVEKNPVGSKVRTFSATDNEEDFEQVSVKRTRRVLDSEDEDEHVNSFASKSIESSRPTPSLFSDDEVNELIQEKEGAHLSLKESLPQGEELNKAEPPKILRARAIIEDDE